MPQNATTSISHLGRGRHRTVVRVGRTPLASSVVISGRTANRAVPQLAIEALQVLEAIQQRVAVGGIAARLELPEPDEPCRARFDRFSEQMLQFALKPGRNPLGDAGFEPAFGVDQRVGAQPLDRGRGRQDRSCLPGGIDESACQVLVRPRQRRHVVAEPVAVITRRAALSLDVCEA